MSVLMISNQTFVDVASTLQHHKQYGRISRIQYILWNKDVVQFVEGLRQANARSYQEKYRQNVDLPAIQYRQQMPMNHFRLLKHLEMIQYNIELDDYEGKEALEKLIKAVMKHIVHQLPEYQQA